MKENYKILILSGPSGSGKSTLSTLLKEEFPDLYFSISTTTRSPRAGEKNGREYFFTTEKEFLKGIEEKQFLEWAKVHNHYYGTSIKPIEEALRKDQLIVFDVDVQGHRSIKMHYPRAKSVFITTPDDKTLKNRLENRQTDSDEIISKRLHHAYKEMQHIDFFDYLIINDDIKQSQKQILGIAHSLYSLQFDSQSLCKQWKKL